MKLSNMASVLRAAGLTVVETQGWANRGFLKQDLQEVRGVLWHHTATNRARFANADAPTLNMCIEGRPDVAGPLCNIVFGRNGTVYLVAAGVANHAGRGTAPGIPENTGNHYLIGIEMESSGIAPWDWTLDQIRVAPHLGAALERAYLQRLPEDMRLQIGHKEYSYDGKIDPAGWPGDMDGLRASINRVLSGTIQTQSVTPKEDTLSAAEVKQIIDHINAVTYGGTTWKGEKRYPLYNLGAETQKRVGQVPARVWATPVVRTGGNVSALQELADTKTKVLGIEPAIARIDANTDPVALADLIPDALAQQVIDKLAERLGK